MTDLYRKSIEIIRANQHSSGAYVASPHFSNYQFCWLRDGSYIAYAMDRAGESDSAEAFFRWVDRAVARYAGKVDRLLEQRLEGKTEELSVLHTRFTLEGEEEGSDSQWGNFQIDGYGSWLWALNQHVRITGNTGLLREFAASIDTSVRYLRLAWQLPNYDCWEEHPTYLHPYSLAAVYGGLRAAEEMAADQSGAAAEAAAEVKAYLRQYGVERGRFVKHIAPAVAGKAPQPIFEAGVDASLLGMAVPYGVAGLDEPVMRHTLRALETDLLRPGGGVYRYKADTYYGGGEWLLLTAWLGWVYARAGRKEEAQTLTRWIESCARPDGSLPEQVNEHALAPKEYQPWVERWGEVASPLLWSHAMYIILRRELEQG